MGELIGTYGACVEPFAVAYLAGDHASREVLCESALGPRFEIFTVEDKG